MPPHPVYEEYLRHAAAFAGVLDAIRKHGERLLGYPRVVAVRPSFRFVDGVIGDERVIQVVVDRKLSAPDLAVGAAMPREVDGIGIDVIEAAPPEQLRLRREALAGPGRVPEWRLSLLLPSDVEDRELAGPLLPYRPPPRPLTVVDEEMSVTCHTSCDGGWPVLKTFIGNVKDRLSSTMYEFTAQHILDEVLGSLTGRKTFKLVLDGKGKRLGTNDLPPDEVVETLNTSLRKRLSFVWAANARAQQVNGGYFPSAYHIKVSVRDGTHTWLSSGNWKVSNQPDVDPFHPPEGFNPNAFQRAHNREWHVVIDNPNLAGQFEALIDHDWSEAKKLQRPLMGPPLPPDRAPDVFVPKAALPPTRFFPPKTYSGKIKVLPLLTPDEDSYFEFVAGLIAGARKQILFENQSLAPRKEAEEYMSRLVLALRDKSNDEDIDVRIIVRGDYGPEQILASLKEWDFRMDRVRLLQNCHTKGLIVDNEVMILGSQNWSSEGARSNRDASLVFWDPRIIAFYTELFEYDWARASPDARRFRGRRLAGPSEPTPEGSVRLPWSAVFEEE